MKKINIIGMIVIAFAILNCPGEKKPDYGKQNQIVFLIYSLQASQPATITISLSLWCPNSVKTCTYSTAIYKDTCDINGLVEGKGITIDTTVMNNNLKAVYSNQKPGKYFVSVKGKCSPTSFSLSGSPLTIDVNDNTGSDSATNPYTFTAYNL